MIESDCTVRIVIISSGLGGMSESGLLEADKEYIQARIKEKAYEDVEIVYIGSSENDRSVASLIYSKPQFVVDGISPYNEDKDNLNEIRKFGARLDMSFEKILNEVKGRRNSIAMIVCEEVVFNILRKYVLPRSLYKDVKLRTGEMVIMEYDYKRKVCIIKKDL